MQSVRLAMDGTRAEIVDLEPISTANELAGYGLLGLLGLLSIMALWLFFRWVLKKLDEKDVALSEQQKAHDAQLERMYTAHKEELAAMHSDYAARMDQTQRQMTAAINNNSAMFHEVKTTLGESLTKMGARLESVERATAEQTRRIGELASIGKER